MKRQVPRARNHASQAFPSLEVNNVTIESDARMASVGNRTTEEQMTTHGIPTADEAAEPNGDVEDDDDGAHAGPEVDPYAPPPKKRSFVSWLFGR